MLENKVRVQVGLPVIEFDVRSEGFKNFLTNVDECVKNNEWDYEKLNITHNWINDKFAMLTLDKEFKDFTCSKYEQVLIDAFETFKDIFETYPKLYIDYEEVKFIVPMSYLVTPLDNTHLNIDTDKPFGINYFYDPRKFKIMVTSDVYVLMRKTNKGEEPKILFSEDQAYIQLNAIDKKEVTCCVNLLNSISERYE